MEILNPELLDWFRNRPQCEICRNYRPVVPHHFWRKGCGGGSQLDVPENLLSVCSGCHLLIHDGHILYEDQLAIVAAREGVLQDEIERRLKEYRDRPKDFEGYTWTPPAGEHEPLVQVYPIVKGWKT